VTALLVAALLLPSCGAVLLARVAARFRRPDAAPGPPSAAAPGRPALAVAVPALLLPAVVCALVGGRGPSPAAGPLDLDQVSRPLLLVAAALYAAALAVVLRGDGVHRERLAAWLLVCFVGNAAVLLAADVVTFAAGLAVITLAVHRAVVLPGSGVARRTGRTYLALHLAGDLALVPALVLVVACGGLRLADAPSAVASSGHAGPVVGLLLAGLAVRACTAPVHGWLPLLEVRVPIPLAAVLSGSVVKVGLVGWLRLLPLGEVALPGWGTGLVVLSLLGSFGVLVPGLLTADAEVSLGYSTVSQMGFLGVLVGVGLAAPELARACTASAVVYAVHHGMAKGGLVLSEAVWKRHGSGPARWFVRAGMLALALAVVGAPLGSGALAKYAAKTTVGAAPFVLDVPALLPLVATGSTLLLARAAFRLRATVRPGGRPGDVGLAAWAVLTLGGTAVTWELVERWTPLLAVPALSTVTLWGATWPVLLGLGLVGGAVLASRAGLLPRAARVGRVPRGDLVAVVDRWSARRPLVRG
jgi:formate hydrogenlyase subunit 3/multisubunit Na+/H+ antiporter MnhD subunit